MRGGFIGTLWHATGANEHFAGPARATHRSTGRQAIQVKDISNSPISYRLMNLGVYQCMICIRSKLYNRLQRLEWERSVILQFTDASGKSRFKNDERGKLHTEYLRNDQGQRFVKPRNPFQATQLRSNSERRPADHFLKSIKGWFTVKKKSIKLVLLQRVPEG